MWLSGKGSLPPLTARALSHLSERPKARTNHSGAAVRVVQPQLKRPGASANVLQESSFSSTVQRSYICHLAE